MNSDILAPFWRASRGTLIACGLFSGVINVLMLTGSLFMLQVYDRVMTSRSGATLVALLGVVVVLFAIQGGLEAIRQRLMIRLGRVLDEQIALPAFRSAVSLPVIAGAAGQHADPMRDVDSIRSFMGSAAPIALFDLPWVPLYVVICYLFHPYLGWLTVGGAAFVTLLAIWGEVQARKHSLLSTTAAVQRQSVIDGARKNAEILSTMNLANRIEAIFRRSNKQFGAIQQAGADAASGISSAVRGSRMLLQSMILALAAYLAIRQEISGGTIIAASIIASRALAPIDQAVVHWRLFVGARQAMGRLRKVVHALYRDTAKTELPPPRQALVIADAYIGPPGLQRPLVSNVNFVAKAGDGIGVIGPSGSGKTTLARALTGIWPLMRGKITLDGAPFDQYSPEALGAAVSYLPQDAYLFEGTVAQNIARFDPDATDEKIVAAAKLAQVHELVLKLPRGYDTMIGETGVKLSSGQRQRVGLARALYGDPFVVVLDEPYSNLDGEGDVALTRALAGIKKRGGIFVLIAHRRSEIGQVDKLVAIQEGVQTAFGPRDAVLTKITTDPSAPAQPSAPAAAPPQPPAAYRPAVAAPVGLKVVSDDKN